MNTWNRFSKKMTWLAVFAAFVSLASGAFAQGRVSTYVKTVPANSYSSIAGLSGTVTIASQYGWYYYNTTTMAMPFAFKYDNQTIAANSTVYFYGVNVAIGSSSYPYGQCLANASYPGALCAWATYAKVGESSTSMLGNIYSRVTGSVGSRVWTLEWTNVHILGGTGRSTSYYNNIQILMYEATGRIQYLYQYLGRQMYGSYPAGVGLNGLATGGFDKLSIQTGSTTTPSSNIQLDPPPPPTEYSLQSKNLNYSAALVGVPQTLTATVTVLGPSPLTMQSVTLTGSPDFKLLNPPPANTVVPYPGFYTFQLQYTPSDPGGDNATLTVVTNAKDSATQSVSLIGTGLAPVVQYAFAPYLGIQYPYNSMFHHVAIRFGDTLTQYMYITNTGSAPLTINNISTFGLQAGMYSVIYRPQSPMPIGARDSIGIRFQPFLEGRPDAGLAINTNAFNQPNDTVTFWGSGKLAHLVVTPQSGNITTGTIPGTLTYDSVAIGDSICKTLVLHNTGTDTLYITRQQVTYGDYDFHFYLLGKQDTMLVPDASKLVNVCFAPLAPGSRVASLRFYTSIPKTYPDQRDTSQFFVQLSGTGVPYGKLAVSGPLTDSAIVGDTKCIEDTIWNTGTSDLTITSAKLSGVNASDFTLGALQLPMMLARGTFQTVQLCYTPSARGLANASLDVVGTSSGRTQNMSLPIIGVGQVVCMDATPNPVAFGSTALPNMTLAKTGHDTAHVHVSNCGDVSLTFTPTITGTGSTNYTVLTNTLTLPAAGNGIVDVLYSPDTLGASTASLTITPNAGSPVILPLGGQGAGILVGAIGQPTSTAVGSSSTFTVTLTNNGNTVWTPGPVSVSAGDFSATGTTSSPTIAPGGTGTISVTFAPTAGGTRTATISFPSSSPMPLDNTLPYTVSATASTSGVAMRTEQDGFAIGSSYPNPAANTAKVIVTLPHEAKISVTLIGLDGAHVATIYNGSLSAGQHVLGVDAKLLPTGTYFYILESGNVRLVREMVVAK